MQLFADNRKLPALSGTSVWRPQPRYTVSRVECRIKFRPSNPCFFFWKQKARETPKKARVFLFAEPLKSLENKGETHKKGNRKKKTRKSKKTRIGVSRQIPAESEMSRQNRATPLQIKVSPFSRPPPSHFPVSFGAGKGRRGWGVAAGWWMVSRHFWVPKTDRTTGGCRSYNHTSRATLCN